MKMIRFLTIFFLFCFIPCPGLLFAGSTDETPAQLSQPDSQTIEEQPAPSETTDKTDESHGGIVEEQSSLADTTDEADGLSDYSESDENHAIISDPLEPINRLFFNFNDKLYFWFLKPVAKGYTVIAPTPVRGGVKNFFSNLAFPIRFVNCLLQVKIEGAGYEMERFIINSTLGLAGFIDMADKKFGVKAIDEDFGQTLGFYGLGNGFYINWPFLGPSSALDTVGLAGDYFLQPTYHTDMKTKYTLSLKAYKTINDTSLTLGGDYEALKDAALDPYVAFRDAYIQHRQNQIKE